MAETKKKSQHGLGVAARNEACNLLIEAHPDEYRSYLETCRRKRGLTPLPSRPATKNQIIMSQQNQIEELQRQLEQARAQQSL